MGALEIGGIGESTMGIVDLAVSGLTDSGFHLLVHRTSAAADLAIAGPRSLLVTIATIWQHPFRIWGRIRESRLLV